MSSRIRQKLSEYETPPPAKVWDQVSAALDAGADTSVANRLFRYEEMPHPRNWLAILGQLKQNAKIVSLPFYIKYRRPLKYSGAAAVFILLAVISSLLLSKKTVSETTENTVIRQQQIPGLKQFPFRIPSDNEGDDKNLADVPSNEVEESPDKPVREKKVFRPKPSGQILAVRSIEIPVPMVATRTSAFNYHLPEDQYMVYSDGDGNAVRLSKKLYTLYSCAETDRNCRQRIILMQEKMADLALTSSFTGIVEILRNLNENQ